MNDKCYGKCDTNIMEEFHYILVVYFIRLIQIGTHAIDAYMISARVMDAYMKGAHMIGAYMMPRTLHLFSPHSLDICLEEVKPQYNSIVQMTPLIPTHYLY